MNIREKTRKHIANLLAEDLDGQGETVMKEIWEEADTDEAFKEANDELRRIIAWLRTPRMIAYAYGGSPQTR